MNIRKANWEDLDKSVGKMKELFEHVRARSGDPYMQDLEGELQKKFH